MKALSCFLPYVMERKHFSPDLNHCSLLQRRIFSYHSPASTQVPLSFHHPASPAREHWEGPPQWAPSSFLPWQCGQGPLGVGAWITFPCSSGKDLLAALAQICPSPGTLA